MASAQILKRRIRSVGNTKQITKAMELVAAAKLRRVQEAVAAARIYSDSSMSILRRLSSTPEVAANPYFKPIAASGKLYIIFNSDGGLAGAYNSNVFSQAASAFAEDNKSGTKPMVVVFGRRGARHFSRGSNIEMIGEYENIPDNPDINLFAPVLETISAGVEEGRFASVVLIFTESVSTMVHRVQSVQLVPIQPPAETAEVENDRKITYEFEPEIEVVLNTALRLYFESALRRARVESAASEHAMRMLSMGNANRNAGDLIDNLTLELNASRQAAITQEVAEIIGGAEAIS